MMDDFADEESIGLGIKDAGVSRETLFVTTKVGRDDLGREDVLRSCEGSLKKLQLDYVDLLLIHWPNADIPLEETLAAFAQLVEKGKVKNIGISNFIRSRVDRAVKLSSVPIAINQVEYHPHLNQEKLRLHCRKKQILLTAFSPLGQGAILSDETLLQIGAERGKHVAQIALRWLLHKQIAAIPKASSEKHMAANIALFDWELSNAEIGRIDAIPAVNRVTDWWPGDFDQDDD